MGEGQPRNQHKKLVTVAEQLAGKFEEDTRRENRREARTATGDEKEKQLRWMKGSSGEASEKGLKGTRKRIEVLRPNWLTVWVYMRSSWIVNRVAGATELITFFETITSEELEATANMLGISKKERKNILDNIRLYMIPAAHPILNKVKPQHVRPSVKNRREV